MSTNEFTKEFATAADYNDARKHAEALGFEPTTFAFYGNWEVRDYYTNEDGAPVFISGSERDADEITAGRKNFTMTIDGKETNIQPAGSNSTGDAGTVRVTFEEAN